MATAALPVTKSARELVANNLEVRVWGMDTNGKPFIQNVTAGQFTEKTAVLTGVLPINIGDVIGLRYRDDKARFSVSWVSDEDTQQTRSIGVDCLEDRNFFVMRRPIPIQPVSTAAMYAKANGSMAKTGVPGLPQMPNRREADRLACRVAADIATMTGTAQAYGWVSDISKKGCYLQMISPFAVGTEIVISMYAVNLSKETPLSVRGFVRTCHPMVGMGVEFFEVSAEDKRRIQLVLEHIGPKTVSEQDSAAWAPAPTPIAPPASNQAAAAPATFNLQPDVTVQDAQPAIFSVTPPQQKQKPDVRAFALRICMDIQKLEAETLTTAYDAKLKEELRQAAVHMRSAWHLYGAEKN
jgi:hypothetical protein